MTDRETGMAGPSQALQQLGERLVGTWRLGGEAQGRIRYEWAEGRRFLIQTVDLTIFGRAVTGVEMIGHLHRVGEEASADIWSRFYSYGDGLTLDYVYALDGDNFTIWFRQKDSSNRFVGHFADDGRSYTGAWAWPGGGYSVTAVRE